jgi:hypothetical protein
MPLPKQVTIGTQTWDIVERTRNKDGMLSEDSYGYTLHKENLIVIDSMISESRKKQTLFHELLHAMRFTSGSPTLPRKGDDVDIWEHYFIAIYEDGVILMLKNNPEVRDYLLGKATNERKKDT